MHRVQHSANHVTHHAVHHSTHHATHHTAHHAATHHETHHAARQASHHTTRQPTHHATTQHHTAGQHHDKVEISSEGRRLAAAHQQGNSGDRTQPSAKQAQPHSVTRATDPTRTKMIQAYQRQMASGKGSENIFEKAWDVGKQFVEGAAASVTANVTGISPSSANSPHTKAYELGKVAGDVYSMMVGGQEIDAGLSAVAGGIGIGAGGTVATAGAGSELAIPAGVAVAAVGVGIAANGAATTVRSGYNFAKDTQQLFSSNGTEGTGKEVVTSNKGTEIDVTPSSDHSTTNENLATGKPNSSVDITDSKTGDVATRRWYDPEGKAQRDVDFDDHGNPTRHPEVPHEHQWDWSKTPPRQK